MKLSYEELLERNGYLAYTNVGTSMLPLLRQGKDVMEIRKKGPERCRRYDAVLYKAGGKYILHRIVKVREKDYVILGDNCLHREYGITDAQILGILTGVVRNGRHISVTDTLYRCHVRVWCLLYPVRAAVIYARPKLSRIKAKLTGGMRKR